MVSGGSFDAAERLRADNLVRQPVRASRRG